MAAFTNKKFLLFSVLLSSLALTAYAGRENVVLVFYRGFW